MKNLAQENGGWKQDLLEHTQLYVYPVHTWLYKVPRLSKEGVQVGQGTAVYPFHTWLYKVPRLAKEGVQVWTGYSCMPLPYMIVQGP